MEWLNYHHLLYFWTMAKEGGLRQAAEKLSVSQSSICAQVHALEAALGEPLFRHRGRNSELTEIGQLVFGYADEIFSIGRELLDAVKLGPANRTLKLNVGVTDSVPKPVAFEILKPVFQMSNPVHIVCREGKVEDLLLQLAALRLDIVLADEPASTGLKFKTFNHLLGTSGVTFCAVPELARKLARGFPESLDGAPALLPTQSANLRRSLEEWFQTQGIRPVILGEFDDAALMKVVAAGVHGFVPVDSVVAEDTLRCHKFRIIGATDQCGDSFYAITGERRLTHPAVLRITERARTGLFRQSSADLRVSSSRRRAGALPLGAQPGV